MSVALQIDPLVSPEDYLDGEALADQKHEYVGGVIYAMAGAKNRHNQIAVNIVGNLYGKLRGHRCQPFNSDTKVRIRHGNDVRFYYPDAMIVCDPNDPDEVYQDRPVALFEVLSESTARIDREEKLRAYQTIESLRAYVIVESDRIGATLHQRPPGSEVWTWQLLRERRLSIPLPEVGCSLPLEELYARTGL